MPNDTCSTPGCMRPVKVQKVQRCNACYQRFKAYGRLERLDRPGTVERFMAKVRKLPNGCWEWTDYIKPNGYGNFWWNGQKRYAHRAAFELFRGAIPTGAEIDHLCHAWDESCDLDWECPHRRCVNPAHLTDATHRENMRRGRGWSGCNARKTHCPQGHEYTPENTKVNNRGQRECKKCVASRYASWRERQRSTTGCFHGHR